MKTRVSINDKVPNLDDKLKKQVVELTKKLALQNRRDIQRHEVDAAFKLLGFSRVVPRRQGSQVSEIFVNKKKKLVVKFDPCLCGRKPRNSCPTFMYNVVVSGTVAWEARTTVVVQPFLDITSLSAKKKIQAHRKRYGWGNPLPGFSLDAHGENVGLYNGKLVQFDW